MCFESIMATFWIPPERNLSSAFSVDRFCVVVVEPDEVVGGGGKRAVAVRGDVPVSGRMVGM